MDIAFDKIIELANARKDALVRLNDLLAVANEQADVLASMIQWAETVAATYRAVDDEGRRLLPPVVAAALNNVGWTLQTLNVALNGSNSNPAAGINKWSAP